LCWKYQCQIKLNKNVSFLKHNFFIKLKHEPLERSANNKGLPKEKFGLDNLDKLFTVQHKLFEYTVSVQLFIM